MIIDSEFKNLIPPLTAEEFQGLEQSILSDGCRDALVVWNDILIDGHNRYEICMKHGIPFETIEMEFDSREDVKLWMMQNQLARRNLNDFQRIEIAEKCADAVKAKAAERMYAGISNPVEKFPEGQRVRDELGRMAGVSGKTYEHAVKVLEEAPDSVVDAARRDELSINSAYHVTRMGPEDQQEIAERIESGETPKQVVNEVKNRPHVANNSGNNEWYTPSEIIEAARNAMGYITLDPASCEIANRTVMAEEIFTIDDDGLEKRWFGNVWLNPPYSSDLIGKFVDKTVSEKQNFRQAIILVNNATETNWFRKLVDVSSAICFPGSRVKFYMPDGKTGAPLQGQAIFYIGEKSESFISNFSGIGWIARIEHGLHG